MRNQQSYWLICPNWTEVRRFTQSIDNKDRFNVYMYIDTGLVTGVYGDKPPLMKTRKEVKIHVARIEWQTLISEGWQITEERW